MVKKNRMTILAELNACSANLIRSVVREGYNRPILFDGKLAMQMYQDGAIDLEIAQAVGRTKACVFQWRKRNGLPTNGIKGNSGRLAHGNT